MKRVLITGAGRGIGAAIARELKDYQLTLVSRTRHEIEELAQELNATAVVADISQPDSLPPIEVDILINNAGIASSAPLHKLTLEEWNRILQVNVTGTMLCSQRYLPAMLKQGWGRIINIASVAGLTGARYITAYAASKHAVVGFTRALADEVAARGVTVNAICPGFVDTPLVQQSLLNIQQTTGRSAQEALASLTGHTPQGRLMEAEEVAYATRFLCHDRARGINGQALVIDGGGLRA
jgi:NAD(P)-dependent dehydrogenase (short-subunit alcohol dehydrogenase family)